MSNGKFFSGLPDCMMNRTNTGPNRQKSNFFWPEESDAPQANPRTRRSTTTQPSPTYDAEFQKTCEEATSPTQRKQMFHKQLESKIEFYDPPEPTPPSRRQTPISQKNTPVQRKEANPTYFDSIGSIGSKKREFTSNIFFNDEQEKQTPNYQKEHNIKINVAPKNNGMDNEARRSNVKDKLDTSNSLEARRNNEVNTKKGYERNNYDNIYENNINNKLNNHTESQQKHSNKMNDVTRDMNAVKLSTEKRHWSQYDDFNQGTSPGRRAAAGCYDRSSQGDDYHFRRPDPEEPFYQSSQNATSTPRPRQAHRTLMAATLHEHDGPFNGR